MSEVDLGLQYFAGMNRPVDGDAGKIVTVDSDGTNFVYTVATALVPVADASFATALAPFQKSVLLRDVGDGTLRPQRRMRVVQWQEDFTGGTAASGSIGSRGWNLLGVGTPTYTRQDGGLTDGKARIATSSTTSDTAVICLGTSLSSTVVEASEIRLLQCTQDFGNAITDQQTFFGVMDDFATAPGAALNCFGVFYDSSINGNWHTISRVGGGGSSLDSGVAATTGMLTIWQSASGTYQIRFGETLLQTYSSGIPTVPMNLGLRLQTLTNASTNHDIYSVNFESEDLAGFYNDDNFLD